MKTPPLINMYFSSRSEEAAKSSLEKSGKTVRITYWQGPRDRGGSADDQHREDEDRALFSMPVVLPGCP